MVETAKNDSFDEMQKPGADFSEASAFRTQAFKYLSERSRTFGFIAGFLSLAAVAFLDYATGNEIVMVLLYLIPIILTSWLLSRRAALIFPVLCGLSLISIDLLNGHVYKNSLVLVWNGATILATFIIITLVFQALKQAYLDERKLARYDIMTGIPNRKMFYEELDKEAYRTGRYGRPFTVAYIDMDNFKRINDTLGHNSGDELLRFVANSIRRNIRISDIVARMGGDEFILLLPETNQERARLVISKLLRHLNSAINKEIWPVSFSIGVLSCESGSCNAREMIKKADELMYEVKRTGKNSAKFGKFGKY